MAISLAPPSLEEKIGTCQGSDAAPFQHERELVDFLENALVGLHQVDAHGTILWANAKDCASLGYRLDEYVGRNIAEFHVDQELVRSILERLIAGETLREQPAVLRCKDGSIRHVLISSNGHFEDGRFLHTRCVTVDVTAQRLAEAALRQTTTHLAAIVESSDDAIIAVDLNYRINSWNRGAVRVFGYEAEEVLGKQIHMLIPPELQSEEEHIFDMIRSGRRVEHYETVRVRKDGRRLDISLTVSPVRDALGAMVGVSKVGRDVTERRRVERELAEASRRKDEFLAILSHELRNPLAPIRYALSVARQPQISREQRRKAEEVITRQVEHMGRLLDDLLDVSRIARGRVELRKQWTDLTTVVGAAVDAARPILEAKGHSLTMALPNQRLQLEADPVRLTQILSNLLTNAAKYTDRFGRIQLRAWREDDRVAIAVRDNGIGIGAEMKPRLFELFSQASSAMQSSEGGLGIGLALVKGFVELHGGTVEALSEGPGKGSEFIVRLPIGREPGTDAEECEPQARPGRRLRVLVADDNVDSAETCAMLLELWGHEVRVAHSGREALTTAEEFTPDVALVDIGMPQLNGYEVAETIRGTPWGADTTLIAVTGWGQEEDRRQAAQAGFDHHITKPVDPSRLQPLLESLR